MDLLKDPGFWGPAFGFLTALVAALRWLAKVIFIYVGRSNIQKAQLDSSVEKMKMDNTVKLVGILKQTMDEIKPVLKEHSDILGGFRASFDLMQTVESEATNMMRELKAQYVSFNVQVSKFSLIGDNLMGRMKEIETEILKLKKGSENIFVTTKKKN